MKQQYTLREFIDETSAESYHGTATKRFVLANLFIKKYGYLLGKHANTKEDKKERANFVYIGLDSVSFTAEKQKNKYFYSFKPIVPPSTDKKELKELKFNNYSYLSPNYAKECKNEEYLSCYEVSEHCKYSKVEAAQVISVILFNIIFACHPFKGRDYFNSAIETPEYELNYFGKGPEFIFHPTHGAEVRLSGFHDQPLRLWKALTGEQQAFFTDAFSGNKIKDVDELLKKWDKAFGFEEMVLRAPCGERIPAILFKNKESLISTDSATWKNVAKCKNCNRDVMPKCKSCPHADKGLVETTIRTLKITTNDGGLGKTATQESTKEIEIRTGMQITGRDIDPRFGEDEVVFSIIPTANVGIIAMAYRFTAPIITEYNGVFTVVGTNDKDNKFKVLPGLKIYLYDRAVIEVLPFGNMSNDDDDQESKEEDEKEASNTKDEKSNKKKENEEN